MKDCALGIVWNASKTEVLLIKRRDVAVWVLPGGGIDAGESPEETVVRELFEETGLHVEITYKAAEYSPINSWTRLTHLYVCHPISGTCKTGDETRAIQFFPLEKLPSLLFDYHREWLQDILTRQKAVAFSEATALPIQKKMRRTTFFKILFRAVLHPLLSLRYLCSRLGFPINS